MSNTKITLYYADWCGHCKSFKPTWNALKNIFDKHNITYNEYEDSKDEAIIEKANISGFPTIMIEKEGSEYQYNGDRSANSIIHEVLPNIQMGGSIKYLDKYLKYKNKYLKLKNNL
jgi:thiol-disulfide isomerase/thioredoxin